MDTDSIIGFWLEGIPYVFVENGLESSKRMYITSSAKVKALLTKIKNSKCSIVPLYFGTKVSSRDDIRINGRPVNFKRYYTDTSIPKILPPLGVNDQGVFEGSSTDITPFLGGTNFMDMSKMICSKLAYTDISTDAKGGKCTTIGHKIATSLIKVAALRIFSDPAQSIIELPVNSFDAYHPDQKVGKFGMGFFSILYWLVGHHQRFLEIISYTKDQKGKNYSYKATIQEIEGALSYKIEGMQRPIPSTGVCIKLDAKKDKFTSEEYLAFNDQLQKLDFLQGLVNSQSTIVDTKDIIYISLNKEEIIVEDFAIGIPMDVLLTSLFIPSISTKTIQLSQKDANFNNTTGIKNDGRAKGFYILVGNVAVYMIKSTGTFIISMPSHTKVPVSRDDIILDETTTETFKKNLVKLYDDALKLNNLVFLEIYINAYTKDTSEFNRAIVKDVTRRWVGDNINFLCAYKMFSPLQNIIPNVKFAISQYYDINKIIGQLTKFANFDTNIWSNVKVIYIEGGGIDNFFIDIPGFIIINDIYKKALGSSWIEIIERSCVKIKLERSVIRQTDKLFEASLDRDFKIRPVSGSLLYTRLVDIYFRLVALSSTYDIFSPHDKLIRNIGYIYNILVNLVSKKETDENILLVIDTISITFNGLKGNQTYGGSKSNFYIGNIVYPSVEIENDIKNKKYPLSYFIDHVIACIKSVEKTSGCYFDFFNSNAPWILHDKDPKIFDIALKYCKNLAEQTLFHAGYGLQCELGKELEQTQNSSMIWSYTDLFISKVVKDINLLVDLEKMYSAWKGYMFGIGATTYLFLLRDSMVTKNWLKTFESQQILSTKNFDLVGANEDGILLSSIINTLFKVEFPARDEDVAGFLSECKKSPPKTPLQIIEIAVNEGTTRPFIEAVLTECVQNSVDAIRSSKHLLKTSRLAYLKSYISITIEKLSSAKGLFIALEIGDFVGMDLKSFLHVSVPFISTKTPSEIVAGEMGTGFFNVYRESVLVEITSRKDGIIRFTRDTPILKDGRVIDIRKDIKIQTTDDNSDYNGTRIRAIIKCIDTQDYIKKISEIESFTKNVLALIDADVATITFMKKKINMKKSLVMSIGNFDIYEITEANFPDAYVLTKGIPFASIKTAFPSSRILNEISEIVVNIGHKGYIPSQARTKIRISKEDGYAIDNMIDACNFVFGLRQLITYSRYPIDHLYSTADKKQLKFVIYSLSQIADPTAQDYIKYFKLGGDLCIAELINNVIDNPSFFESKRLHDLEKKYPIIVGNMIHIAKVWLQPKKTEIKEEPKKKSPKYNKTIDGYNLKGFGAYLNKIVQAWVKTAKEANIKGYSGKEAPTLKLVDSKDFAGSFDLQKNVIEISVHYWKDIKNLEGAETADKYKETLIYKNLLSYTVPCAVLVHEMEHYRRMSSHAEHDSISVSLWPGDQPKSRSYNDSANAVYEKLLIHGFPY